MQNPDDDPKKQTPDSDSKTPDKIIGSRAEEGRLHVQIVETSAQRQRTWEKARKEARARSFEDATIVLYFFILVASALLLLWGIGHLISPSDQSSLPASPVSQLVSAPIPPPPHLEASFQFVGDLGSAETAQTEYRFDDPYLEVQVISDESDIAKADLSNLLRIEPGKKRSAKALSKHTGPVLFLGDATISIGHMNRTFAQSHVLLKGSQMVGTIHESGRDPLFQHDPDQRGPPRRVYLKGRVAGFKGPAQWGSSIYRMQVTELHLQVNQKSRDDYMNELEAWRQVVAQDYGIPKQLLAYVTDTEGARAVVSDAIATGMSKKYTPSDVGKGNDDFPEYEGGVK